MVAGVADLALRLRHFGNEEQRRAVAALQRQVWLQVVARFEILREETGLRQSDLARALGVSRPQIHEWLSDPANMTLKAASRLMLAMDAELSFTLVDPSASARPRAAVLGPTRVTLILTAVAAFFLLGAESVVAAPASNLRFLARPEVVARLDGPAVALFWRADCGPCLLELKELAALRAAAAPIKVYTVALDAPPVAKQRLETLGVDQGLALAALDAPEAVLAAYSGGAPRLPLAVAIARTGEICARHVRLLGTDRVRAWARSC